jgi:succinate dehydrogenase/fumarate reductase-like Fe-S protein
MLSSVLNSKKAIEINIAIMRTFVIIRKIAQNYSELSDKIKEIEGKFPEIYNVLNYLMKKEERKEIQESRIQIGYKK